MRIVKEVYASWRAEVVFVTSNRQNNKEIMGGCMEAGIPVFVSLSGACTAQITDSYWSLGDTVGLLMVVILLWSRERFTNLYVIGSGFDSTTFLIQCILSLCHIWVPFDYEDCRCGNNINAEIEAKMTNQLFYFTKCMKGFWSQSRSQRWATYIVGFPHVLGMRSHQSTNFWTRERNTSEWLSLL
jgi:hypothetical protein